MSGRGDASDSATTMEGSIMPAAQPTLTLNNGVELPALGFGVFQTPPDVTQAAVEEALRVGYRMVDTAASYLNEREVGAAIAASGVPRSELFVQTKLWVSDYGYDAALHAFDVSTRKLGLDTIDLYLLHQPLPQAFDLTVAAYRAAERLLADGRVRAIGVSNFSTAHLGAFLPQVTVVPAVNQVEVHPYYNQRALRDAHRELGIVTQAWSPLGQIYVYRESDPGTARNVLADPVIVALATKYGRTPAQVVLRWHLDSGRSAIPKSVRPERIAENFDVFGFSLGADEVAAIDALDTGVRGGPNQDALDFRTFGVTIPE
jgi:diketogulonate reductase-like aldo/keto reductase